MDGVLGFVMAGVALAGSPGPATLSLAATGAAFGVRRGLAYMSGIIVGMLAVMAITATGVVATLLAVPGAARIILALAGGYFLYLAWRIAAAPPFLAQADAPRPAFGAGLLLSLINPKGYAAMAGLFSGFVLVREQLALDAAVKAGLLLAIITVVNIVWLAAGGALLRLCRAPRAQRLVNATFAALLVASVAATLWF